MAMKCPACGATSGLRPVKSTKATAPKRLHCEGTPEKPGCHFQAGEAKFAGGTVPSP